MSSNNVLPAASSGLESPVSNGPGPPGPFSGVSDNDVSDDGSAGASDGESNRILNFYSSSPSSNYNDVSDVPDNDVSDDTSVDDFVPFNFVTPLEEVKKVMDKLIGAPKPRIILGFAFSNGQMVAQEPSSGNLNLHASIETQSNSTKEAVTILAKYMEESFQAVPCFGFGDVTTLDKDFFSFFADHQRRCNGIEEILSMYQDFAQHAKKGQSISLVPIIHTAMDIVDSSGGQHHILFIFTGMAMQLK